MTATPRPQDSPLAEPLPEVRGAEALESVKSADSPQELPKLTLLAAELMFLGVPESTSGRLLARYPAELIERQLYWMRFRTVRDPARFIVAAIERGFEEPYILRRARSEDE